MSVVCITIFMYLIFMQIAVAQVTLKGKIFAAENNKPLQYAEVFVNELNKGAISNGEGVF